MIFKKKKLQTGDLTAEERFERVYHDTKDLNKADFKRFIDGIILMHDGHEIALKVKTREEREDAGIHEAKTELDDIDEIEKSIKESK